MVASSQCRYSSVREPLARLGQYFLIMIATGNVCQNEQPDARRCRERGGFGRGKMPVIAGDGRIALEKSRLDHQHVGIANVLSQAIDSLGIANDDKLLASLRRPEDVFGIDRLAIRECNGPSFRQLLAHGTVRHPEGRKAVWPKMATDLTFEGKPEAVCVAVGDRKAPDREGAGVEDLAGRQRNEI